MSVILCVAAFLQKVAFSLTQTTSLTYEHLLECVPLEIVVIFVHLDENKPKNFHVKPQFTNITYLKAAFLKF